MYTVILLAALAQPQGPSPGPQVGLPPVQGVARIHAKGTLAIARVSTVTCSCYGSGDREIWLHAPEKKPGEKVMVKAKVTRVMVSIMELPAHVVVAYSADGQPIEPAKLAELLAQERTVLIATDGKKVDPFQLQLYKEDTIVLVPPANLEGLEYGPYRNLAPKGPYEPPLKKLPSDKDRPKTDETSSRPSTMFVSQDDEIGKAPEAPALNGIGGILRIPAKLPRSFPPTMSTAVRDLGELKLTLHAIVSYTEKRAVTDTVEVQVPYTVTESVDGRDVTRTAYRTEYRTVQRFMDVTVSRVELLKQTVPAEKVKAFTVTKGGRLEAIPKGALLEMLAKPAPALVGESDVDPCHLELIRPGTLFLAIPPGDHQPAPLPKEPIQPRKEIGRDQDTEQPPDAIPVSLVQGVPKEAPPDAPAYGTIDAAIRKRGKLPASYGMAEVVHKDGTIHLTQQVLGYVALERVYVVDVLDYVALTREVEVQVGDRLERRQVTTYEPRTRKEQRRATVYEPAPPSWVKQTIAVKAIKAFVVSKDGKLEPLEFKKLLDMIAKPTRVLIGGSPDVDSRDLELIRAGTIYLALPPRPVQIEPANLPQEKHEQIPSPKGAPAVDTTPNDAATIEVNLSSDVPLSIDGKKTSSTGKRRIFITPPLPRDKAFTYEFQAFWPSGRTDTVRVFVRAGNTTWVDIAESKQ